MLMWFNPACSKCAMATEFLQEQGIEVEQRRYLDDPPTAAELAGVLDRLGLQPWELARLGEPVAVELGLAGWPRDRERWIAAMVAHPQLIQRPVLLLDDGSALVARSTEALADAVRRSADPDAPARAD